MSWELDALSPTVLSDMIEMRVVSVRNSRLWRQEVARENGLRQQLGDLSDRWDDVHKWLEDNKES